MLCLSPGTHELDGDSTDYTHMQMVLFLAVLLFESVQDTDWGASHSRVRWTDEAACMQTLTDEVKARRVCKTRRSACVYLKSRNTQTHLWLSITGVCFCLWRTERAGKRREVGDGSSRVSRLCSHFIIPFMISHQYCKNSWTLTCSLTSECCMFISFFFFYRTTCL